MSTVTIPAAVVPRLREGTQQQLALAAEQIRVEVEAYEKDVAPLEVRAEMDRAWALLDVLGWAGDVPETISVELPEHAVMLRAAVESMVASLAEVIAELPEDDPTRAERIEELQALREFEGALLRAIERAHTEGAIIAVPAHVAVQLRHAFYADLSRAGADLEAACATKELGDVASPVGKLRRLFAVLDEIGWSKDRPSPEALTIHGRHLRVVVDTLEDDWDGWERASEQTQLEDLPGREHAKAMAEMIERFLATLPTQAMRLAVPPVLIAPVREGAEVLAKDIAETIDNGCDLHECAARLTAVAALLDVLDTADPDAPLELDIAEHGTTLRGAVTEMLPMLEKWATETKTPDRSEPKREDELRLMRQLAAQVQRATGGDVD